MFIYNYMFVCRTTTIQQQRTIQSSVDVKELFFLFFYIFKIFFLFYERLFGKNPEVIIGNDVSGARIAFFSGCHGYALVYLEFIVAPLQVVLTIILPSSIHRTICISAPCRLSPVCFSTNLSPSAVITLLIGDPSMEADS